VLEKHLTPLPETRLLMHGAFDFLICGIKGLYYKIYDITEMRMGFSGNIWIIIMIFANSIPFFYIWALKESYFILS